MTTLHTEMQKQILSNQVLAEYFLHSDENVQLEKIDNGFFVQIPDFVVMEQLINQTNRKNISDKKLSANALKILEFAGCWVDDNEEKEEDDEYFSSQSIALRREKGLRDRYL